MIRPTQTIIHVGLFALTAVHCGGAGKPEPAMLPAAGIGEPRMANLTDPQIVAVIATADSAEIGQAQLAQSKSENPQVLSFASRMLEDHGQAQERLSELELGAEASPTWKTLSEQSQQTFEMLKDLTGEDFDHAYLQTQVKQHEEVLNTIARQLLPSAENPTLRAQLEQMKQAITLHLQAARGALLMLNESK